MYYAKKALSQVASTLNTIFYLGYIRVSTFVLDTCTQTTQNVRERTDYAYVFLKVLCKQLVFTIYYTVLYLCEKLLTSKPGNISVYPPDYW